MKILWSRFAYINLSEIYTYHVEHTGLKFAKKLRKQIFLTTKPLITHPEMGRIEESLIRCGSDHRFLVCGTFKIIYKQVKEGVLITDVFDTRQNPEKINRPNRNLE